MSSVEIRGFESSLIKDQRCGKLTQSKHLVLREPDTLSLLTPEPTLTARRRPE